MATRYGSIQYTPPNTRDSSLNEDYRRRRHKAHLSPGAIAGVVCGVVGLVVVL
jgi:hypothetical protein